MAEGDSFILGYSERNLSRNLQERRAILILPQKRQHLAAEPADFAVGQNRLETVTDLCPVFVIVYREQHHYTAIFALRAYAPFFE